MIVIMTIVSIVIFGDNLLPLVLGLFVLNMLNIFVFRDRDNEELKEGAGRDES
jgi:hypothetical protein